MKPAVWLFILFIVASGLSAWIGNDWGRRIGKRKLTVFALRPKHSSSLLTILLSIALSLGCMGIYLLIDPAAREALLDPASRDERQLQAYQQQISSLNETIQRLQDHAPTRLAAVPTPGKPAPAKAAKTPAKPTKPAPLRGLAAETAQRYALARPAAEAVRSAPEPRARPAHTLAPRQPAARPQPVNPPATKPAPVAQPVPLPETQPELALAERPQARDTRAASAGGSWQRMQSSVEVAMLDAPIFELRVYGGRNHDESSQIIAGVLELTRAYARGLGLSGSDSELLALQTGNLAQSRQALEQDAVWQMQVQIGKVSDTEQALPVRLVMQAAAPDPDFDPNELLEDARLNPGSQGASLQQDLQLAMADLVKATRADLALEVPESLSLPEFATAHLPFSLVALQRRGQTLQAQILLPGESANLTEN